MPRYPRALSILIAAAALLRLVAVLISIPTSGEFHIAADSESRLAVGQRLSLWTVELYELELIPKVSDRLAKRILLERADVRARAAILPLEEKYQALEAVRGIGAITARRLSQYVDLSEPAATKE